MENIIMEWFVIVWIGTMFLSLWIMVKLADRKDAEILYWKSMSTEAGNWKLKYSKSILLNEVKKNPNV